MAYLCERRQQGIITARAARLRYAILSGPPFRAEWHPQPDCGCLAAHAAKRAATSHNKTSFNLL
jgi:hypothetical protein